jgi:hypothetical protein
VTLVAAQTLHGDGTDAQQLQQFIGAIAETVIGLAELHADLGLSYIIERIVSNETCAQLRPANIRTTPMMP